MDKEGRVGSSLRKCANEGQILGMERDKRGSARQWSRRWCLGAISQQNRGLGASLWEGHPREKKRIHALVRAGFCLEDHTYEFTDDFDFQSSSG